MTQISQEQLDKLNSLALSNPQDALALLSEYDDQYPEDINLGLTSGGILIDIGSDLLQNDLVLVGITRIEAVVKSGKIDEPVVFYNLANGYSTLNNLYRQSQGKEYKLDPDDTHLLQAKHYYRETLRKNDQLNHDLRAQLWVNYGNCLSGLGRSVEALFAYDQALRFVPDHPMAKGNLAEELYYFARITHHPVFILDAYEMLEETLSENHLDKYAGACARQSFEHSLDKIADDISRLGLDRTTQPEQEPISQSSDYKRRYVGFCAKQRLFLNLCHSCHRCNRYIEDNVAFSLISDLDDKISFTRLARVVNEIKERYAFARLLLFQALYPNIDTVPIDDLTNYVDNLDYAVYGTRVASLKLAYEGAYNVLDKVAHFLNDYLEIGLKVGRSITFTTNGGIWREKKNGQLRPVLKDKCNYHLMGLYDVARDLDDDGYWGYLRLTRNALTHEYLILHVEIIQWATDADKESLHLLYEDFVDQAVELLRLVRSVVIYLIAFIDLEERRKHKVSDGLIVPSFTTLYDASLFSSSLDGKLFY